MPDDLTPGDGQDILARFRLARERRDPDLMLELYATDAEYRPDPFDVPLRGALALREHWNRIAADQAHVDFDAERVWVVGRTVLSSWHGAFTRRASSERVRVRGFSTMEIDNEGRILRMRDWPSWRTVGRDAGHPSPEALEQTGEGEHG